MVKHALRGVVIGFCSVATASAAGRSPSRLDVKPTVLTVAMVGQCAAPDDVLALARTEAEHLWAPAGVSLRWVQASEVPYGSPTQEWLIVRCSNGAQPAVPSPTEHRMPIAAIRFIADRPTNTIVLNVANAETLLQRETSQWRGEPESFVPFREIRLGRMLGRAIAHEIGHFLTQSGGHTRRGLMRASHSVAALTGASRGPFRVPDTSHF